ncbi:MAG: CBO2463/CBO2479 domain-containing protein [Acidaminobacteraceae bacterium]
MSNLKYANNIILMEGIIVEIKDGSVSIDLKGRLGSLKVPMRMLITDYELKIGQEVGFNMSYPEVLNENPNQQYVSNLKRLNLEENTSD